MSKVDALRAVQLDMIEHPDTFKDIDAPGRGDRRLRIDADGSSTVLSPEFWAAFTISGDWR
jgi:CHAT domain-containing protein